MLSAGDADAGGTDVKVAVLVVAALRGGWIEVEFDVNRIG